MSYLGCVGSDRTEVFEDAHTDRNRKITKSIALAAIALDHRELLAVKRIRT